MEAPTTCRGRKDPVARFNTFEQPEDEIKAQIENASRTQRAIRARATLWPSKTVALDEATDGLQHAPGAAWISKALDCPTRPESVNAVADLELYALDRTFSFNSLSTLQRGVEAARLSQWRDSPVSAFSPTDRAGCSNGESKVEEPNPYPPLAVYKLKQSRKDEKVQRKSIKKQEKEQKKAEKAAAHKRRHSTATAVVAVGAALPTTNSASSAPRRATSDPSFKASKDAAVQFVKKLTARPMTKLSRRSKLQTPTVPIPHVDDFISKPDLQEYLNSELPQSNLPIAELPGPLPPYTPFQNSTANANNSLVESEALITKSPSVHRTPSAPSGLHCDPSQPQRMMRCDKCQFGIKLDDYYFQCSICDNGDRIICHLCDAAGESCRHELTRRRRQVLGYHDDSQEEASPRTTTHRRHDLPPRAATFGANEETYKQSTLSRGGNRSDTRSGHTSKTAMHELQERKHLLDLRDLEIRRREQDLTHKERESALRAREAATTDRQVRLEEREAEAEMRAREFEATARAHSEFSQHCSEMATSLGSQFASLQAQLDGMSLSVSASQTSSGVDDTIDFSDDRGHRTYAGKRKASGKARNGSSTSTGPASNRPFNSTVRPDHDSQGDDDDDDGEPGTPKKMKHDPESSSSPGKLYACHFCKHNSLRYSEKNNTEKQYRGCSSGYWPDISRLKQHLYRVHWRNHHCGRCFVTFKKLQDLQMHVRAGTCEAEECPYPEKFDHGKYQEIRKKRPTSTPEEVWYVLYGILFPGETPPATPFAESEIGLHSSPASATPPAQPWDAIGEAFESRLDQYRDVPDQAWLRLPGAREFIREQLRASMVDVLRQMTPTVTPAPTPLSGERSPQSANGVQPDRSLSIPTDRSLPGSPVPLSASSTRSSSSAQWRLPNHRRSFSRPLPRQTTLEVPDTSSQRPNLSLERVGSPLEMTLNVHTVANLENDQYDDECSSWHQNDDSLGLAITTNGFDFEFQSSQASVSDLKPASAASAPEMLAAPVLPERSFEFRPVKISSLSGTVPANKTATATDTIMIDSAYGSLESNQGGCNTRPNRHHVKSTARAMNSNDVPPASDVETEMPIPEHELNFGALEIPWQDFVGTELDMDVCGNIEGRSLTEYLYG